jgi:RNA polymerase sigma-70 factor (ECF subfamily)
MGGILDSTIEEAARTSESELLRRAMAGDRAALETLFGRNSRALYQTALRLLGNPEDAEDALQEGMLAAYRNLRRFEGRSQFSTWLTRIVINAALMRRRSQRAHPAVSLDERPGDDLPMPPVPRSFVQAASFPRALGKILTIFPHCCATRFSCVSCKGYPLTKLQKRLVSPGIL